MSLTNEITKALVRWCNNGSYDIVLPKWFHGRWEMDVMRITGTEWLIEYEVKVTKADFKADALKSYASGGWNKPKTIVNKHAQIAEGKRCNRFYFVTPAGLLNKDEIPKWAGLIEYRDGFLLTIKNAPILHRNKFSDYREVAKKLSFREFYLRSDLRKAQRQLNK